VETEHSDPSGLEALVEGMRNVAGFADLMVEPGWPAPVDPGAG
jgi:hypothetical protein